MKSPGSAECVVSALDADGDGHGNQLCSAAPGDDCDDSSNGVAPDATEACDGVDNDCDGLLDIDDGLPLGGNDAVLVEPLSDTGSLAVASVADRIVILDTSAAHLIVTSATGSVESDTGVRNILPFPPVLVAEPTRVMILGYDVFDFKALGEIIAPDDPTQVTLKYLSAARINSVFAVARTEGWLTAWTQDPADVIVERGLFARTVAGDGTLGSIDTLGVAPVDGKRLDRVHMATNGTSSFVVWTESNDAAPYSTDVKYAIFDDAPYASDAGVSPSPKDLTSIIGDARLGRPQVAPIGDGFLVAFVDLANELNVAVISADGTITCGPRQLAIEGTWNDAHALASNGNEVLAVMADMSRAARLYRLSDTCTAVGESVLINDPAAELARGIAVDNDTTAIGVGHPAITTTASGFATVWIEQDPAASNAGDGGLPDAAAPNSDASSSDGGAPMPYRLMMRTFGPSLCE